MNGWDGERIAPDPVRVNGGDDTFSYKENSYYQRLAADAVKEKIVDAITRNLNVCELSSASNIIRLADLGCAVGSNTINAMQDVLEVIKNKCHSQCPSSKLPEFQVFFNDKTSNDFNTLFTSLPQQREYYSAGVPGSFHHRLFPQSSIHFAHCSYALHWLSKVPEELLDENSPAWNKGRIHYTNAAEEVVNAYASQFAKDMENFLNARAEEIQLITEAELDSFNLPIYSASSEEMVKLVDKNGHFSIKTVELTNPTSWLEGPIDIKAWTMHVRAAMEAMFSKHFRIEIIDEMFNRLIRRLFEFSDKVESDAIGSITFSSHICSTWFESYGIIHIDYVRLALKAPYRSKIRFDSFVALVRKAQGIEHDPPVIKYTPAAIRERNSALVGRSGRAHAGLRL
ncbi:putative S-adenosyl-L-methionine:salicylic acid carboxyl methyltransferase [Citrus sinensis]|uniref:S-adenosyl-L-methionine:salicylic acid carboxyl methyltransferase n=1 Tax=Citrus sinensis TaxID=2711 RepID=A0ACB8N987_CITSI|nr:putative S-adenosyl-L-methionine:salicylic acid carboxyl methyltransferase [Citrus sinensis]